MRDMLTGIGVVSIIAFILYGYYKNWQDWVNRIFNMKQILLMIAAVALMGCASTTDKKRLIASLIVEKQIRIVLKKPEGELTKTDLNKVTKLHLAYTKITNAGLKEVTKLTQLTELHLHDTGITDVGLRELAKMKQLTWLALQDTQITDTGIKELHELSQLTLVQLASTKVTKAGVAELQKALPKCEIFSDF